MVAAAPVMVRHAASDTAARHAAADPADAAHAAGDPAGYARAERAALAGADLLLLPVPMGVGPQSRRHLALAAAGVGAEAGQPIWTEPAWSDAGFESAMAAT